MNNSSFNRLRVTCFWMRHIFRSQGDKMFLSGRRYLGYVRVDHYTVRGYHFKLDGIYVVGPVTHTLPLSVAQADPRFEIFDHD